MTTLNMVCSQKTLPRVDTQNYLHAHALPMYTYTVSNHTHNVQPVTLGRPGLFPHSHSFPIVFSVLLLLSLGYVSQSRSLTDTSITLDLTDPPEKLTTVFDFTHF